MTALDPAPSKLSPLQGLLLDLIVDQTRDPARMGLLAMMVSNNVLPFRAVLASLDYETFAELSDACTRAEFSAAERETGP